MKYYFSIIVFSFFSIFSSFGLSFDISFTASGATTLLGNVLVQNLTSGKSVLVPVGNVLNLTDITALAQINSDPNNIKLYSNKPGIVDLTFNAKFAGKTAVSVFCFDGKKQAENIMGLNAGFNNYYISLPQGDFIIQVSGNGFNYSAKISNSDHSQSQISIQNLNYQTENIIQKVKNDLPSTSMIYSTGDVLLYKSITGIYSNVVIDVPTSSKNINFNFEACTDADGNNYSTVTIGTQTWMAENLKTTSYNDGTSISNITENSTWTALKDGAYTWYNNDISNKQIYGAMYNWCAVSTGKLAPNGWHVPTDTEYNVLINYVGGLSTAGAKLKETGTTHWESPNTGASNAFGFTSLPGGGRNADSGEFSFKTNNIRYWSSSETSSTNAKLIYINYSSADIMNPSYDKNWGMYVRCVRN